MKTLEEIGFNEEFKINEAPVNKLKALDSLKPFFKDVMKFASFITTEIEEEKSLTPLQTEVPFDEKEIIEANKEYIFEEFKLASVEVVEKGQPCSINEADTKQ